MGILDVFKRKGGKEGHPPVELTAFEKAKSGAVVSGIEPGPAQWFTYFTGKSGTQRAGKMLTWDEMRTFYLMVPALSSSINSIAREISNMQWSIVPREQGMKVPLKVIRDATLFFQNPNSMKRPFSQFIYVLTKGLGLYSRSAIENAFDRNDNLVEIYARDASTIVPLVDEHGIIHGYKQIIYGGGGHTRHTVNFTTDQLVFIEYNPDDYAFGGAPIIDGLINVCKAIINSISYIAKNLDYNEIPPGLAWAKGWTQKQADMFAKSMKAKRDGARVDFEFPIIGGVDEFHWEQFKKDSKETRELESLNKMEKIVHQAYGITSVESGEVQDVNRATALTQITIGQSKLIRPMVDLLTDEINQGIIWSHIDDRIKIKAEPNVHRTREKIIQENETLIPLGLRTVNEGRELLGESKLDGGDNAVFIIGGTLIKVSDLDKESVEVNPMNVNTNQPSKNQADSSKVDADVKKIFQDRKYTFLKSYIGEYSREKGNVKNSVNETANHLRQKLFDYDKSKMNVKEFYNIMSNALKTHQHLSKKGYLTEKEAEEDRNAISARISRAYDEFAFDFIKNKGENK